MYFMYYMYILYIIIGTIEKPFTYFKRRYEDDTYHLTTDAQERMLVI